uniref:Uncharacterized protein LOC116937415 n=1 Tax=Petromyzon marinus TaxID=7757 RepID=A0AAJ7SL41_PETMA|nr:uncharacterized protein LOC116937415 [Petromyzon marinus]
MNHPESVFFVTVMAVAVHVTNSANRPIQYMAAVEGEDVLLNCSTSSTIDRVRWRCGQSNTTILFCGIQRVTYCNPSLYYVVFSGNLSSGNGSITLASVPANASGMYHCFLKTSTADRHEMVYNLTVTSQGTAATTHAATSPVPSTVPSTVLPFCAKEFIAITTWALIFLLLLMVLLYRCHHRYHSRNWCCWRTMRSHFSRGDGDGIDDSGGGGRRKGDLGETQHPGGETRRLEEMETSEVREIYPSQ